MNTTMSTDPAGTTTVALHGDLDARTALDVGVLLRLADAPRLRLDVSSVCRVHADGLRTLTVVMRKAHRSGRAVTVCGARPAVALVLSTAGIVGDGDGGPAVAPA